MPHLLVLEDDERLGRQICDGLSSAGFETTWLTRGDEAIAFDFAAIDLVVLDLMLPGMHGLDVLRALRRDHHQVPVLVLSARQGAEDRVRSLELGADDYLTKPFWPEELVARVRARLRRPALAPSSQTLVFGGLRIDLAGRRVTVDGVDVDVTRLEFALLEALARRAGAAVSRQALADRVLANGRGDGDDRSLDVHMSRLRRKLGLAGQQIVTVWGVGYRLEGAA